MNVGTNFFWFSNAPPQVSGHHAAGLPLAPNVDVGLMCELFQKTRLDITDLCHDEAARFVCSR